MTESLFRKTDVKQAQEVSSINLFYPVIVSSQKVGHEVGGKRVFR